MLCARSRRRRVRGVRERGLGHRRGRGRRLPAGRRARGRRRRVERWRRVPLAQGRGTLQPRAAALRERDLTGTSDDYIPDGHRDAYGYASLREGVGRCLWLYLPPGPERAAAVAVGVYVDAVGTADPEPGELLASAQSSSLVDGWNALPLDREVRVPTVGASFWIAAGTSGATLRVLTRTANSPVARGQHTSNASLTPLDMPSPWTTSARANDKKFGLAAYVTE